MWSYIGTLAGLWGLLLFNPAGSFAAGVLGLPFACAVLIGAVSLWATFRFHADAMEGALTQIALAGESWAKPLRAYMQGNIRDIAFTFGGGAAFYLLGEWLRSEAMSGRLSAYFTGA